MSIIFDGNDVRVSYLPGASARTIAFFVHHFSTPNLRREWGRNFAEKYAIDAMFFSVSRNHWWNTPEFAPAVNAAQAASKGPLIGYGVSMGGTGALLAFPRAIAVAPQASVDPMVVPWETRWTQDRSALRFTQKPARARSGSLIIVDPSFEPDARHASLIGGKLIRLPGAGHRLAENVAIQKKLARLILATANRTRRSFKPAEAI